MAKRRGPDLVVEAMRVRSAANVNRPAFSTKAMVEAAFPGTVVTGRVLPVGVREVVSRTADGPVIVYSRALTPPDQRFVIAHALAHLLFDGAESACRAGFAGDPVVEARADAFAAELLMPLDMIAEDMSVQPVSGDNFYLDHVDEMSSRYNVPQWLADQRIREVSRR